MYSILVWPIPIEWCSLTQQGYIFGNSIECNVIAEYVNQLNKWCITLHLLYYHWTMCSPYRNLITLYLHLYQHLVTTHNSKPLAWNVLWSANINVLMGGNYTLCSLLYISLFTIYRWLCKLQMMLFSNSYPAEPFLDTKIYQKFQNWCSSIKQKVL
jgi:hypothetical protein